MPAVAMGSGEDSGGRGAHLQLLELGLWCVPLRALLQCRAAVDALVLSVQDRLLAVSRHDRAIVSDTSRPLLAKLRMALKVGSGCACFARTSRSLTCLTISPHRRLRLSGSVHCFSRSLHACNKNDTQRGARDEEAWLRRRHVSRQAKGGMYAGRTCVVSLRLLISVMAALSCVSSCVASTSAARTIRRPVRPARSSSPGTCISSRLIAMCACQPAQHRHGHKHVSDIHHVMVGQWSISRGAGAGLRTWFCSRWSMSVSSHLRAMDTTAHEPSELPPLTPRRRLGCEGRREGEAEQLLLPPPPWWLAMLPVAVVLLAGSSRDRPAAMAARAVGGAPALPLLMVVAGSATAGEAGTEDGGR